MNGKLIVFEGIDCSGKTTQAKLLKQSIKNCGYACELLSEKHGNDFIEIQSSILHINGLSSITKALIYNAIRIEHTREILVPALAKNDFVIMDRRELSTYVYQGILGGVNSTTLFQLNNINPNYVEVNCVFLIDVSHKIANKRILDRDKVTGKWNSGTASYYNVFSDYPNLVKIDGEKDEQAVHKEIVNSFNDFFEGKINESF